MFKLLLFTSKLLPQEVSPISRVAVPISAKFFDFINYFCLSLTRFLPDFVVKKAVFKF